MCVMTALIEYLTSIRVYRLGNVWEGLGPATPEFGHATAQYSRVSTILKVLSLAFNTVNNLCSQVHDKLVGKCLFTTMLTQLKQLYQ